MLTHKTVAHDLLEMANQHDNWDSFLEAYEQFKKEHEDKTCEHCNSDFSKFFNAVDAAIATAQEDEAEFDEFMAVFEELAESRSSAVTIVITPVGIFISIGDPDTEH